MAYEHDENYVIRDLRKAGMWHSDEDVPCQEISQNGDSIEVTIYPEHNSPYPPRGY